MFEHSMYLWRRVAALTYPHNGHYVTFKNFTRRYGSAIIVQVPAKVLVVVKLMYSQLF